MEFLVLVTPSATPDDLFLPSPVPVQVLDGSSFQAPLPALDKNLVVFSVVPDSSERKNTVIFSPGSSTSEFSLAIFSSSKVLMLPLKIPARTSAFSTRLSTPSMLYAKVIGPVTLGRFHAVSPRHRSAAISRER